MESNPVSSCDNKSELAGVNINEPRYDQSTFDGRKQHFNKLTNPLMLLIPPEKLNESKDIVKKHRAGEPQKKKLTLDELWEAKYIYDTAFHPFTEEEIFILGRIPALIPVNMILAGCLITFYKNTLAVIFWQWLNQTYNALFNYSNRFDPKMPQSQAATSYALATVGAVGTAVGLKKLLQCASTLVQRLVPLAGVLVGHFIGIPTMKQREITEGICTFNKNNRTFGQSKTAGREATKQVLISRLIMAAPTMTLVPIVQNYLTNRKLFCRRPYLEPILATALSGIILSLVTPIAFALYPQKGSISITRLEKKIQDKVINEDACSKFLHFFKGL